MQAHRRSIRPARARAEGPGQGAEHDLPGVERPATCARTSSRSRPTVLARTDPETGRPLVDLILDEAAAEGHGKWTKPATRFDVGAPIRRSNAAWRAGSCRRFKAERVHASRILRAAVAATTTARRSGWSTRARRPLREQGDVLRAGVRPPEDGVAEYGYNLQPVNIARIWRAGASSEPRFSATSWRRISATPRWPNLLLDDAFRQAIESRRASWRFVITGRGGKRGSPAPA